MRRARRFLPLVAAIVGGFALASRVFAEEPSRSLDLEWSAPASCPDKDEVARGVDRLLGGATIPAENKLTARARVEATKAGFRLHLVTTRASGGPSGERTVDATTCRAVADAAEVILALAIDPSQAARVAAAAASAPSATPVVADPGTFDAGAPEAADAARTIGAHDASSPYAEVAPPPPAASAPTPKEDAGAPPISSAYPNQFAIGLGGGGDVGSLPHLAPALAASFAYFHGAMRLGLDATYLLPSEAEVAKSPSRGGRLWLLAGGARACYLALGGTVELGPCARVEAGILHGEGFGARVSDSANAGWFALGGGGMAAVKASEALALRLDLDALVPTVRTEFVLGGIGPVHRPAPLVGRGVLSAEVRF